MNLDSIETKCFILSLFIRDDGQRFLLGSGAYEFKKDQLHFAANTFQNDIVEVQGDDGTLLAGQVRRASTQVFDGYIGDSTVSKSDIETYRRAFFTFFRKNHFYTVVYIFNDGTAIQRRKGFIVDAPEVKELWQLFPAYHVALNFEDVNYYTYNENAEGQEVYGKTATINLSTEVSSGGVIWDEDGATWDSYGLIWEPAGNIGPTIVQVDSVDNVFPIWEVQGPATNPQLSVITTNTTINYTGTVTASQTLKIDMFNKTATLNGTSVIGNVSGDWVCFAPGNNRVVYTASNADAESSNIYWQEIVG